MSPTRFASRKVLWLLCVYESYHIWIILVTYEWVMSRMNESCDIMNESCHIHTETMVSKGGVYLYHKMTPPSNLGCFWVIFEGWSQILPSIKLFCHGFEQSCSAMATKKLEEKVQQHDENAESKQLHDCRRVYIRKNTHTRVYIRYIFCVCIRTYMCILICHMIVRCFPTYVRCTCLLVY